MLITHYTLYQKPYITMCVGMAKFMYSNKYNILVILNETGVAVYKNGKLLGTFVSAGIYTEVLDPRVSHYDNMKWDKRRFCGWSGSMPHNIPFYDFDNYLSIFGFSVIQFRRDSFKRTLAAKALYEKVTQN